MDELFPNGGEMYTLEDLTQTTLSWSYCFLKRTQLSNKLY